MVCVPGKTYGFVSQARFVVNAADSDYVSEKMEGSSEDDDVMEDDSSEHSLPSSVGDVELHDAVDEDEKNITQPTHDGGCSMYAAIQ